MTHTTKVTEMKATEKGALDGFKVECTCGFTATNIFKFNAQTDSHNHVEYMEKKEKKVNKA